MIPETGTKSEMKQAVFGVFCSPKKGETWFLIAPIIPYNDLKQRIPLTISSVTSRWVRYLLRGEMAYQKGHMSVNNFTRMAVLGDVMFCQS